MLPFLPLTLDVVEDFLELREADEPVVVMIVLLHYLVKLLLSDLVADLVHGGHDVVGCDPARLIGVKLVENSFQHLVVDEVHYVYGGHQEFSVVDLAVAIVIDFVNYFFDLVVRNFYITKFDALFELFSMNQPRSVLVQLYELLSQILNFVLVRHLD